MFITRKAQSSSQLTVNSSSSTDYLQLTRVCLCKQSSSLFPPQAATQKAHQTEPSVTVKHLQHLRFSYSVVLTFFESLFMLFALYFISPFEFLFLSPTLHLSGLCSHLQMFPSCLWWVKSCTRHLNILQKQLEAIVFFFSVSPCWMVKSVVLDPAPVLHADPR